MPHGKKIKQLCRLLGIKHETLASVLGLERSLVTKRLSGGIKFTVDEMLDFCEHWHLDFPSYLAANDPQSLEELSKKGYLPMKLRAQSVEQVLDIIKDQFAKDLPEDKKALLASLLAAITQLLSPPVP